MMDMPRLLFHQAHLLEVSRIGEVAPRICRTKGALQSTLRTLSRKLLTHSTCTSLPAEHANAPEDPMSPSVCLAMSRERGTRGADEKAHTTIGNLIVELRWSGSPLICKASQYAILCQATAAGSDMRAIAGMIVSPAATRKPGNGLGAGDLSSILYSTCIVQIRTYRQHWMMRVSGHPTR